MPVLDHQRNQLRSGSGHTYIQLVCLKQPDRSGRLEWRSGNDTIGTAPVFDVPFNIVNWVGNVTLNNLYIDADDTDAALVVDSWGILPWTT